MLDDKLKALWTRISPPQKAAFFGCFLSGYLVHLYVFTNIIPNSDGLSRIFDPQQMTVSGRYAQAQPRLLFKASPYISIAVM